QDGGRLLRGLDRLSAFRRRVSRGDGSVSAPAVQPRRPPQDPLGQLRTPLPHRHACGRLDEGRQPPLRRHRLVGSNSAGGYDVMHTHEPVTQLEIDQRVFDLYDEYCHGGIDRREFLARAALVVGGLAMAQALLPRYAEAQTISFTDTRIKAQYVSYSSPDGNSGQMRGYLVQPAGPGPFPAVLVIHENRGLNPYIEDVARRAAVEGFVALAPDGLFPVGGYPGNDDDGRALQGNLDQAKLRTD